MELNEFIKEVIVQINGGISSAEKELGKKVIAEDVSGTKDVQYVTPSGKDSRLVSNVVFELSLINNMKDGKASGIGVFLANIGIGTKENSEIEQTSLSKIRFNVPILLG